MVTCKACGYVGKYTAEPCPLCGRRTKLTKEELAEVLKLLLSSMKGKDAERSQKLLKSLADEGYTDAIREYARFIEKSRSSSKNLDLAMDYYFLGAKNNDPYSAFSYSRLISRVNSNAAFFWLVYSALLGCSEAYPTAAEEMMAKGNAEGAVYFLSLAAASDDVESIVKLSKMYYEGDGIEKDPSYAKWYMDKLKLPPIYAIKLAYKLRGEASKEPPQLSQKAHTDIVTLLAGLAKRMQYDEAYFNLSKILMQKGDAEAAATVAKWMIWGKGCEADVPCGMKILQNGAKRGEIFSHIALAELYFDGNYVERNIDKTVRHYTEAGRLGSAESYERIGDIFALGKGTDTDVARAMDYYALAIGLGSESAQAKSEDIKAERDRLFKDGLECLQNDPDEAFRLFAASCAMGHVGATFRLGTCLEYGIGTKTDRHGAFLLYKKASELGERAALVALGVCYGDGIGTRLDYTLARDILTRAEKLGISGAADAIMTIMERKKKKLAGRYHSTAMRLIHMKKFDVAKAYLDVSAEMMDPRAIYTLGCMYEFGLGAVCDKERAFALYEKAYAMLFRDPRAEYKLSVIRKLKAK
jgi:TPR repeat protein